MNISVIKETLKRKRAVLDSLEFALELAESRLYDIFPSSCAGQELQTAQLIMEFYRCGHDKYTVNNGSPGTTSAKYCVLIDRCLHFYSAHGKEVGKRIVTAHFVPDGVDERLCVWKIQ
jgi:hypothetical protein